MTESVQTGATTNFLIVTQEQMNALNELLFYLIRQSHEHERNVTTTDLGVLAGRILREKPRNLHELLQVWSGK